MLFRSKTVGLLSLHAVYGEFVFALHDEGGKFLAQGGEWVFLQGVLWIGRVPSIGAYGCPA